MKDTISYSEYLFLNALERRDQKFDYIFINSQEQQGILGLHQLIYMQMVITLAEDGYIEFEQQNIQLLVGRLRGEIPFDSRRPSDVPDSGWANPRDCLQNRLIGANAFRLFLTYRGMRRIEELRERLKQDRILEPFGVLLDMRYFVRDLEEALQRSADTPISVMRLDLDGFKKINDDSGHAAGDIVMKSYLQAVRDSVGSLGSAYRGRGDEVAVLMIGLEHQQMVKLAEKVRISIQDCQCKFNEIYLPKVTASIGVATSPPEKRTADIETIADSRQNRAKKDGKNRIVAA